MACGWGFVGRKVRLTGTVRDDVNGLTGIIGGFNHGDVKCESELLKLTQTDTETDPADIHPIPSPDSMGCGVRGCRVVL